MICAIQKNLCVNKFYWKLLEGEGSEFWDVWTVLDNIMKYVW